MIAVFCPVHTRVDLAYDQLLNYKAQFYGEGRFFLHLSKEAREKKLREYSELVGYFDDVEIVDRTFKTSGHCVFGAFLACSEYLFENYGTDGFEYVYLHTDADLILRNGVANFIHEKKYGFGSTKAPVPKKEKDKWGHARSMHDDDVFWDAIKRASVDPERIFRGRQEGAFFSVDLWEKIFSSAQSFFPWDDYFSNSGSEWPVEEVFIPTICKSSLGLHEHAQNVIYTKPLKFPGGRQNPDNAITKEELVDFWGERAYGLFGAKRFPLNINHDVRKLVRKRVLGEDLSEIKLPW